MKENRLNSYIEACCFENLYLMIYESRFKS